MRIETFDSGGSSEQEKFKLRPDDEDSWTFNQQYILRLRQEDIVRYFRGEADQETKEVVEKLRGLECNREVYDDTVIDFNRGSLDEENDPNANIGRFRKFRNEYKERDKSWIKKQLGDSLVTPSIEKPEDKGKDYKEPTPGEIWKMKRVGTDKNYTVAKEALVYVLTKPMIVPEYNDSEKIANVLYINELPDYGAITEYSIDRENEAIEGLDKGSYEDQVVYGNGVNICPEHEFTIKAVDLKESVGSLNKFQIDKLLNLYFKVNNIEYDPELYKNTKTGITTGNIFKQIEKTREMIDENEESDRDYLNRIINENITILQVK